jgi:ParB family chromosome partitioning protein
MGVIDEPSHQLRQSFDESELGQLADSMAAEGLHQPIGLRGPLQMGRYEIIWGHRRFKAASLLHWRQIPAKVLPADFDPVLAAISENLQRSDLTPVEEARAVTRFIDRGFSKASIARTFRRSPAWVEQRAALLGYPEDIQQAIHEKTLPLGVASVLAEIDADDYRRQLIAEAQRQGCTLATAELWRAHFMADRERIIQNFYTVQQIIEKRDAWRIVVACDYCGTEHPYEDTRTWRLCLADHNALAQAVAEARSAPPAES